VTNNVRILAGGALVLGVAVLGGTAEAGQLANDSVRTGRRLLAVRATGPITLDGRLDEPDWDRAPVATDFVQNEPHEGQPATEDSEVRVLYDVNNLYIGVFAHDAEPTRIIVSDLVKDFTRGTGDEIEIVLDTFHDERNGYLFAINAWGAKWDAQMVNEGREQNDNWDGLWDVRTRITETGWVAEIAIPFRTLRFGDADPQTWGINFHRRIRRKNEDVFWSPVPRIYDVQRVSMAGTLEGLQGIRPGIDLRVKPYVLGSSGKSTRTHIGHNFKPGLDVKYGVTKGLTWDFTANTDFAQVEADEQQVNLTRFNLFFPEKRDFFLENSGVFQFGQGNERIFSSGGGGSALGAGFSGQTNPRDPVLFFSRRIGLSNDAQSIPILGGTRLTGRAGAYSLGVLNIQQRSSTTSPSVNFTALRLRRDVLGNSDVGVLVLNKDDAGPHYNRLAGADANFRFFQNLNINTYAAKSFSPVTITDERGSDTVARAGVNYRGKVWDWRLNYLTIGERFNDEMGFLERIGTNKTGAYLAPHLRPKASRWLRDVNPHWEFNAITYAAGDIQSRYADYHLPLYFQNSASVEAGLNATTENLIAPFAINRRRNIVIPRGRYDFTEWFVTGRTDASRPLAFSGRWGVGDFYDGSRRNYQIGGALRVSGRLNASLLLLRNEIDLKAGRYTTNLVTGRIDYGFSTRAFLNALVQYNTDAGEWSSNVRFNIIHHPLSDFFLVVNERRETGTDRLIDRAVIAKMTYMVAF
jgi:hypothetical protein